MENKIVEFSKALNKQGSYNGEFTLNASNLIPNYGLSWNGVKIIQLDQEDIEYFKKKYLPKLEEEMNEKINKIREEYGK